MHVHLLSEASYLIKFLFYLQFNLRNNYIEWKTELP